MKGDGAICHLLYHQNTVKQLYFAGCIFRRFRELAFIREIYFQRKLFPLYIYIIRTPVHKTALYKNFKKAHSALPTPNDSLSGRMPQEAIT